MSTTLQQVLADRAERATPVPDIDTVMAVIRARSVRRTRRTQLAAGGGATVIAAAAAAIVVVAATGDDGGSHALPAGSGDGPTPQRSAQVGSTPVRHGDPAAVAASRARLARKERERALASARAAAARPRTLVPIDPAPSGAEVSITLVPKGFGYLGHDTALTGYGPPKAKASGLGDFSDKIVVDVHERAGSDGAHPLTINGRPASYGASDGYTTVRIVYNKTTDVGFQAPPSAHLTRNQALRIAKTLEVRSTAKKTHG